MLGMARNVPGASLLRVPGASLLRVPGASLLRVPSASLLRVPGASLLRVPSASLLRVPSASLLRVTTALALVWCALGAAGCGPSIPARFVLERDIGALTYRRYQRVLDVELAIEGNPAVGHTATYVRRSGEGAIPYVNAFVTVYERPTGLAAEIRRLVRSLASYDVSVIDVGGRAFSLDGGPGDRWVLWVSANRVVKVGGTASDELVRGVVSEYMGLYPSDLDENGRARAGTASAGDASDVAAEDELDVPRSLAEEPEGEGTSGGEESATP